MKGPAIPMTKQRNVRAKQVRRYLKKEFRNKGYPSGIVIPFSVINRVCGTRGQRNIYRRRWLYGHNRNGRVRVIRSWYE